MTLIEGGFGNRASEARRRTRRRRTVRAAAPLLIPIALALTLGVILAVSSGTPTAHVNQQNDVRHRHEHAASVEPAAYVLNRDFIFPNGPVVTPLAGEVVPCGGGTYRSRGRIRGKRRRADELAA